jgi:PAS domain S-box-containing protein
MIIFGYAFGTLLGKSLEQSMFRKSIDETSDIVIKNVVKHFKANQLLDPKKGKAYKKYIHKMDHLSLGKDIVKAKVWNRDLLLVWGDDEESVGKPPHSKEELAELQEAFEGDTAIEESISILSTFKQLLNSTLPSGKYHELFVPIRYEPDGEVVNVFEVYQTLDPLIKAVAHHKHMVWIWTILGFSCLYVVLFVGFWEASTRINRQTKQIKQAKLDWEETFNSITDIISVHDRDFNIIQYNKAAHEVLGCHTDDAVKRCFKHFHGTDEPREGCPGKQSMQTGAPATLEFFEPHLNKFIEARAIPRTDGKNHVTGFIHIVRDISERKHSEELIQTQLNHLSALRSIDKAIIGSMDLSITLDIFLDQVINHLNIDAASVLMMKKQSQTMEYVISKGFRSAALKYTRLKLGESNAGRAAIERQIVSILDLKQDIDGFACSRKFADEGFVSYFAVPLIAKGHVKGVLELFHRSHKEADEDWVAFLEAVADQGAIAIDNATLFDELEQSNVELILAYNTTIEGWSRAMDMRDKETEGHTQRVSDMTVYIAREMGVKDEDIVHIRRGALLHDMGKMGIPDSILLKPGPLTDDEWEIMRRHPQYAYDMLYPIKYLRPAIDIPFHHHEKWDGTGYPKGLKGAQIPLSARIFAIVDVWDALRSDRPYRAAWPKEKVMEHVQSLSGTHFDPMVVYVFMKVIDTIEESVITYSQG